MKIVNSSSNLTPVQLYKLTVANNVQKMKDVVGQRIEIAAFAQYEDTDNDGKEQEILAVMTPEGEVFASNSPTFIREFNRMVEFFAGYNMAVDAIKVTSGTSKNGRDFIACEYAE